MVLSYYIISNYNLSYCIILYILIYFLPCLLAHIHTGIHHIHHIYHIFHIYISYISYIYTILHIYIYILFMKFHEYYVKCEYIVCAKRQAIMKLWRNQVLATVDIIPSQLFRYSAFLSHRKNFYQHLQVLAVSRLQPRLSSAARAELSSVSGLESAYWLWQGPLKASICASHVCSAKTACEYKCMSKSYQTTYNHIMFYTLHFDPAAEWEWTDLCQPVASWGCICLKHAACCKHSPETTCSTDVLALLQSSRHWCTACTRAFPTGLSCTKAAAMRDLYIIHVFVSKTVSVCEGCEVHLLTRPMWYSQTAYSIVRV